MRAGAATAAAWAALLLACVLGSPGCGAPGGRAGSGGNGDSHGEVSRAEVSGTDETGEVVAVFAAAPSAVRVGDRIRVTLEILAPPGTTLLNPPVDLPPLVVAERRSPEPDSGALVWTWEAAAFQVGPLETPALVLAVRGADGREGSISLGPLGVQVVSVLEEGEEDLADIRGPAQVPMDLSWITPVLAGAACLALMVLLIGWIRRRVRAKAEKRALGPPPEPAHLAALRRLDALRAAGPPPPERLKPYYVELTETLRDYLEQRYGVEAPERTTEELAFLLRRIRINQRLAERIVAWLSRGDMVKFARQAPGVRQILADLEEGYAFVRETAIAFDVPAAGREAV